MLQKKKDFETFERGLDFIKDIETYITVIEKKSNKINEIIRLDNLKFKKMMKKIK